MGAKLPGRAATDEASAWFGNVAETGKVPDDQGRECFALFLRPFTDAQNRRHLLKTSASPTGVPDKLVDPPPSANQPYSVVNLGSVYRMLDEDLRRSLLQELPGAPGLPQSMMEYGEKLTVETPQASPMVAAMGTALPAGVGSPAVPATLPQPAVAGSAPVSTMPASGPAAAPGLMIAQPRKKKAGPTQVIPAAPAPPLAAVESVATPEIPAAPAADVTQAPPAVVTTAASPTVTGAVAAPSGTSPPPPPGMRPPMRAPGS